VLLHKLCNLIVELCGAEHHQKKEMWQELLNKLFAMVNSESTDKVEAALLIFNGLFDYLIDYFSKYTADLMAIFKRTITHTALDVQLAALQALSNFIQVADLKDTRQFSELIPQMVEVPLKALAQDEETVIEDSFIEFNEIAEVEAKFFRKSIKDIYEKLYPIVAKNDYVNRSIRLQPVEFFVTLIEHVPVIAKKDHEFLKNLLDLIFKLMIDIDEDIDDDWKSPPEGYRHDDEEQEEDAVNFGKTCIDRLVSSVGDETMLPLLGVLVQTVIANDSDWRYKHAALMAFSQVGEYVDSTEKISPMIPVVL